MYTEDLDATIAFYSDILGFICVEKNDDWGWASLNLNDVWIMLARPNEHTPYDKIGFTGSFYFTTDDVEAMWQKLKDKARVCYDIETFPWGMREFAIRTPDGHRMTFGSTAR